MSPYAIAFCVIGLIILGELIMLFRRKRKSKPKKQISEVEPKYRTWIVAPHRLIEVFHPKAIGPAYRYNGSLIHLAQYREDSEEELERYIPPGPPRSFPPALQTPEGLFSALDWRLVRPVYRMEDLLLEKMNTALMFGLLGALLFFLYLIFTNVTGG